MELSIGDADASTRAYQFASIQDIVVTLDGTIWVLDGDGTVTGGQAPLLRQYDAAGHFLREVGREGSGPGEFLAPHGLALMQDGRVALRDFALADRITFYTADGVPDTTWPLRGGLFWTFGGGWPIQVDTGGVVWIPFREGPRPGPDRRLDFLRVRPDGRVLDTVPFPSTPEVERERVQITRTTPTGGTSVRGFVVPYQPYGRWAWSPFGNFAVSRTDQYRIEVLPPPNASSLSHSADHEAAASSSVVIGRDVPPVPVPEAERADLRRGLAERVSAREGGRSVRIPEMAAQKPPIRYLKFSEDGRLLVTVSMPSRLQDGEWTEPRALDVFDLDGGFTGRVVLPDSFRMLRMRGDHLWGVFRGAYGVESIRRYRIVWP